MHGCTEDRSLSLYSMPAKLKEPVHNRLLLWKQQPSTICNPFFPYLLCTEKCHLLHLFKQFVARQSAWQRSPQAWITSSCIPSLLEVLVIPSIPVSTKCAACTAGTVATRSKQGSHACFLRTTAIRIFAFLAVKRPRQPQL